MLVVGVIVFVGLIFFIVGIVFIVKVICEGCDEFVVG